MPDDKKRICQLLLPALRATRHLDDLIRLEYDPDTEQVVATFENGAQKLVNVALDSGFAMIKDIAHQLT